MPISNWYARRNNAKLVQLSLRLLESDETKTQEVDLFEFSELADYIFSAPQAYTKLLSLKQSLALYQVNPDRFEELEKKDAFSEHVQKQAHHILAAHKMDDWSREDFVASAKQNAEIDTLVADYFGSSNHVETIQLLIDAPVESTFQIEENNFYVLP